MSNNQLANPQKCVLMRSGAEIWVDSKRLEPIEQLLLSGKAPKFLFIDGQFINTFELEGIFSPTIMEERTRRKNGQWKCRYDEWHERGQICGCAEVRRYHTPISSTPDLTPEEHAAGRVRVNKITNDLSKILDSNSGKGDQGVAQDQGGVGEAQSS